MGCAGLPDGCPSCVCINFYEGVSEKASLLDVYPVTTGVQINNGSKSKLYDVTHA
jgi:hypothetical protein